MTDILLGKAEVSEPLRTMARQRGMPDGWAMTAEISLLTVYGAVVVVAGLAAALALQISPQARPVIAISVVFVGAFVIVGLFLHLVRYYRSRFALKRAWREWDNGGHPADPPLLSSDVDFLVQLVIALPVTIWFALNVPIVG